MARQSEGLTESNLLYKTSCPRADCGSSDGNAVYDDGHTYCFVCSRPGRADGEEEYTPPAKGKRMAGLIFGNVEAIPARKLDDRTCQKYNYQVGSFDGQKCHIAPFYDAEGTMVAQKVRLPGKDFKVLGDLKSALPLYGQHLCRDGGKLIVVTEGEIDAMSVTQAMGLTWPAVSVPQGAPSAKKFIAKALGFLEAFDKVVFMFDQDEVGQAALAECLPLFSPGKAFVAQLPADVKDANDLVKAGRSKELIDAVWGARKYVPEVLNDIDDDLIDDACEEQGWGLPWPYVSLTKATYGILRGCVYTWGAGTGSGKTTLMRMLMATAMRPDLGEDHSAFMPMPKPRPIGTILYEEPLKRTLKNLAGLVMKQRIHVPGTEYDKDEARKIMRELRPLLKSISLKGARDWETVKNTIRYLHASEGVEDFVIDPMTALTAGIENERQALDGIMSDMAELAEDLDITIHLVFHLATPEGKSHEDGGRVQEKHFRGSRAVAFWSHFLFGLERNKQDPDCPTIIRGLKDRPTGDAIGPLVALSYDKATGHMVEVPMPEGDDDKPFKDESHDL
jgi:twinkle protein